MNILITGNLSSLATTFVKEFVKHKYRVVLASENVNKLDVQSNYTILHSMNPAEDIFRDAMSSYGFDVIIFLATREEQLCEEDKYDTGRQLDGLRNTLELSKHGKLTRFFYISSTEVYGNMANRCENIEPIPASINGHTLSTGEHYCKLYQDEFGLNITILRVPYIYGADEKTGLLYKLIQDSKNQNNVLLQGCPDRVCSFLHVNDVADFLKRAIDEEYSPEALIVNLSSSATVTNSRIAEVLNQYVPNVTFKFDGESGVFTGPAVVSTAKKLFDWVDLHEVSTELEKLVDLVNGDSPSKRANLLNIFNKFPNQPEWLKYLELILGAVLTQSLSQLTGTLIQYKYVDFRLLFVVVMASVYGLRFGLLASLLISLSLFYTWFQVGVDWSLLIYNVGNWFPVVLYFIAGLIIGYNHDRTETIISNEKKQTQLIFEKYGFLYQVFNEIRKLKDEFREQVIGYRDSFGKIYTITRELDTLQEQDVYFRALTILEDLMENKSIAIYHLEPNRAYARLEVNSTPLTDKLEKSLKLTDFPEAVCSIEQGTIFQNTALLPDYPAYIAPILNNTYPFNVPVAIIVIWSVKFEQYSTYYYNLFKVICGLIQASLLRAAKFLDANYEKIYVQSTRILKADAFRDVLRIRAEMNKNKVATDQMIMVERSALNFRELYSKLNEGIQAADIIGMRRDGNCYVLLSQADRSAAQEVIARFEKLGVNGRLLDGHERLFD